MMQQRQQDQSQRLFTASEVAEYEYCPLAWWHEQYEPLVYVHTEELFARLVEMEHENGQQATALPEYQVVEQLLLRRGAFDKEQQSDDEAVDAIAEIEPEDSIVLEMSDKMRLLALLAAVLFVLSILFIVLSLIRL